MLSLQLMVIIMMTMIRRCQWWWLWWLKDANDADDYTDDEKQVTALVNWPGCKFFRIAEIKARCCICYTSLHLLHILASFLAFNIEIDEKIGKLDGPLVSHSPAKTDTSLPRTSTNTQNMLSCSPKLQYFFLPIWSFMRLIRIVGVFSSIFWSP